MYQSALTIEDLRAVIADAYEQGYHGCLDCRDGYVIEAMERLLRPLAPPKFIILEGFRRYTVKELKAMPEGTFFEHQELGYCWVGGVDVATGRDKAMQFPDGSIKRFVNDKSPWDKPMRRLAIDE